MPRNSKSEGKKTAPKRAPKSTPSKRATTRRAPVPSERLERSLVPGVLPPVPVPQPEAEEVKLKRATHTTKSFKQIEITPDQVESFGFNVTIDPTLFQKVKKSTGKITLPVGFDGRLFAAIDRYNPRRGGVSSFVNQACARWMRDNIDQVLLSSLDANAKSGSIRNSMVSIDPDIALKLKAAVTLLKTKGFAKCTIQGLILGCCLLQARDLKLV